MTRKLTKKIPAEGMKNPKVDVKGRVVCGYVKSMNMYCFHKINKKSEISKIKLPSVIAENFSKAVDRANTESNSKLKKTRYQAIFVDGKKFKTWDEYIKATWKKSQEKKTSPKLKK